MPGRLHPALAFALPILQAGRASEDQLTEAKGVSIVITLPTKQSSNSAPINLTLEFSTVSQNEKGPVYRKFAHGKKLTCSVLHLCFYIGFGV